MSHATDYLQTICREPAMSTGNFQGNLMEGTCTALYAAAKDSTENMSAPSVRLARYNSAPASSAFATLPEQDFYPSNDGEELVQFLAENGLGDYPAYGDVPIKRAPEQVMSSSKKENSQAGYPQNDVIRHRSARAGAYQEHLTQGLLSAILEHSVDEAVVPQPSNQQSPRGNTVRKPAQLSASVHSAKAHLVRHNSLPTDFLSRIAMADMSERPEAPQQAAARITHTTSPAGHADISGGKVYVVTSNLSPRGVPFRKSFAEASDSCKASDGYGLLNEDLKDCGLVRQSSSPAGLLSQLTLDEFSTGTDKVAMASVRGLVHGPGMSGWDEAVMDSALQRIAEIGQRKRGREADARLFKGLGAADLLGSCPPSNHYLGTGDNMALADAVLCRSRAKRGCATHPRSIAERVRRTKISERMKKLQDLVPNLDKQAHTADMLDEVVEYVKLLQRQVQELLQHSHECQCARKAEPCEI